MTRTENRIFRIKFKLVKEVNYEELKKLSEAQIFLQQE